MADIGLEEKTVSEKIEKFLIKCPVRRYKKGEVILRPGDSLKDIFQLKSGYVRIYSISKNGKENTLKILKPMFYLSLIGLINLKENRYYFEAITPVEIFVYSAKEGMRFLMENDDLIFSFFNRLTRCYRELLEKVEYLIAGNAYSKVASLLYSVATFSEIESNKMRIDFDFPHWMIASMTGLTRETVTNELIKMEKENIIRKDKRAIIINDLKKLKDISSFVDSG